MRLALNWPITDEIFAARFACELVSNLLLRTRSGSGRVEDFKPIDSCYNCSLVELHFSPQSRKDYLAACVGG